MPTSWAHLPPFAEHANDLLVVSRDAPKGELGMIPADASGAGSSYPAELECDVLLSDGRTAHLRAIRSDDGPALRSFGEKLSRQTVYFRFFSPRRRISDTEITHFVTVDYQDRLALVATIEEELVAVARYDVSVQPAGGAVPEAGGTEPVHEVKEAEVAFVVRDDHQGRGLGTVMLEHLASAAVARGIGRFVADTLPENYRMIGVFRAAGFEEHARLDSGVVRVTMELAPGAEYLARVEQREWTASVRSIEHILRPSSVAVVGAPDEPGSASRDILRNLVAGGYTGEIFSVGSAFPLEGGRPYRSVTELAQPVDLAVVAVPAPMLAATVRECGERRVGGLVVTPSGSLELEAGDEAYERELVEIARTTACVSSGRTPSAWSTTHLMSA